MKLNKTRALIGAALFALPIAIAGAFELEHSAGTLKLDNAPERIVSFDLAVLDSMAALGIPAVGVPKSMYEGELAVYKDTKVVGTLFEPDYAALNEVKPDLIFSGRRSMPAVPELEKIAPTVHFTPDPFDFLGSFRQHNLALAEAFGQKEQAEKALKQIDENLEALHAANSGKTGALLFIVRGNIIAHAPGDRFGYAYELAGLKSVLPAKDPNAAVAPRPEPGSPAAEAAAKERARVIAEVAQAEPDWLIVLDRSAINGAPRTAAETLAQHPQLSQTRAYKEGRVYYVDPNGWYIVGGGLNNMQKISERMLAAMK